MSAIRSGEERVRDEEDHWAVHQSGHEESTAHQAGTHDGGKARSLQILHPTRKYHHRGEGEHTNGEGVLEITLLHGALAIRRRFVRDDLERGQIFTLNNPCSLLRLCDDDGEDLGGQRFPEDAVAVDRAEDELNDDGANQNQILGG